MTTTLQSISGRFIVYAPFIARAGTLGLPIGDGMLAIVCDTDTWSRDDREGSVFELSAPGMARHTFTVYSGVGGFKESDGYLVRFDSALSFIGASAESGDDSDNAGLFPIGWANWFRERVSDIDDARAFLYSPDSDFQRLHSDNIFMKEI